MEESKDERQTYSLWAIPSDDVSCRIKKLMEGLRAEFGGAPHYPYGVHPSVARWRAQQVWSLTKGTFLKLKLWLPGGPITSVFASSFSDPISRRSYLLSTSSFLHFILFSLFSSYFIFRVENKNTPLIVLFRIVLTHLLHIFSDVWYITLLLRIFRHLES